MNLYQKLKNTKTFFLIAGPCVIESEEIMFKTVEFLKKETAKLNIPFVFKASYRKANRTSIHSEIGVGLEAGLKLLQKIKNDFNVPILTDVHETKEVSVVAEVADIIQIPAFLSRQTDLIVGVAKTGKIINIKKGQFMAPENIFAAAEKASQTGNEKILLTERGVTFGYNNLVVDFRSFAIMKKANYPIIYDVTHSLQRPSLGETSGGTPEFIPMMASAAIATGKVDGLFIETHPEPKNALSDASTMLKLDKIPEILERCLKISEVGMTKE
ncbi:MAG: 3-deoxy-8-phosphooctulonate synthase [Candidatus Cloacimonetes bacterium]|nr:3-deoxy-8-phosphooctulonate synthase [Candidatus Cloacimonadota bacterium]